MNKHIERGQLLLQQSRMKEAQKELTLGLAQDPQDAFGHAMMSLCLHGQGQPQQAVAEARQAVGISPQWPFAFYVLALALDGQDKLDEAMKAIGEALRLDPTGSNYYAFKARLYVQKSQWQEALGAADEGLQHDGQHADCLNWRAMALRQMGRMEEAIGTAQGNLARDPENAESHATQGWTYLHTGEYDKALEHFRESLRLEPGGEHARQGMVEALQARYWLYRPLLRYFLWMGRLSGKAQWAFIIGLLIAVRLLRAVMDSDPSLKPLVVPLLAMYFGFVCMTWIGRPLFNLLLRMNRFGRYALSDDERKCTTLFAAALGLGAAGLVAGLATKAETFYYLALWCGGMLIPIAIAFRRHDKVKRYMLRGLAIAMACLGLVGLASIHVAGFDDPWSAGFCIGFMLMWGLFPWLAQADWKR